MKTVLTGRTALDIYRLLFSPLYAADDITAYVSSPDDPIATATTRICFRRLDERECREVMEGAPERRSGAGHAWRTLAAIVKALLAPGAWTPLDDGWLRALVPERPPTCVLVPYCATRLKAHDVSNRVLAAPLVDGSIVNIHVEMAEADLASGPDAGLELDLGSDANPRAVDGSRSQLIRRSRRETGVATYDLYLTSPELTYLMLARDAGRGYPAFVRLVQVGYELCGHYLMPPTTIVDPATCNHIGLGKDSFRSLRSPLTSHDELADYLQRIARYEPDASATTRRASMASSGKAAPIDDSHLSASDAQQGISANGLQRAREAPREEPRGILHGQASRAARTSAAVAPRVYGVCTAERALAYVLDHSASPVECYVAMLICLSRPLGGYGLTKPEPNAHVGFSKRAQTMARKNESYADLLWRDRSGRPIVSIEYNSTNHHARVDESIVRADMRRGNAIGEMGIRKIDLTWDQLRIQRELDAYMESIAAQLGQRQRPPSAAMLRRRAMLRTLLLGSMSVPSHQRAAALAEIAQSPCDPF